MRTFSFCFLGTTVPPGKHTGLARLKTKEGHNPCFLMNRNSNRPPSQTNRPPSQTNHQSSQTNHYGYQTNHRATETKQQTSQTNYHASQT